MAEYDGPKLLRAVYDSTRELVQQSGIASENVAAVCLDGMISGTLGIDDDGDATTPYTTTLDTRFFPQLNWTLENFHDPIRQLTGSGQPTIAPKMLWIRDEFPDVYKRTAKFVTISGYIVGKMAGLPARDAFVDSTYLWASGLSDTQAYRWSDDLCQMLDLPADKLPRIVRSSEIIGSVGRQAAGITGLREGTPIVAGCSDQSAGFIGAAITKPNRMASNAGTYPVLAICTDQFNPDMQNRMAEIIPSAIPGLWNPTSYIVGGGLSHHWFQETFCYADEVAAAGLGEGRSVYDVLDANAGRSSARIREVVLYSPPGRPRLPGQYGPQGRLVWLHLDPQARAFLPAVLESIAYDQFLQYRNFAAITPNLQVEEVTAYGGGAKARCGTRSRRTCWGCRTSCWAVRTWLQSATRSWRDTLSASTPTWRRPPSVSCAAPRASTRNWMPMIIMSNVPASTSSF